MCTTRESAGQAKTAPATAATAPASAGARAGSATLQPLASDPWKEMGNLSATSATIAASSQASSTVTSASNTGGGGENAYRSPIPSPQIESQSLLSDSQSFSTWQPEKSQEQVAEEAKSDRQDMDRQMRKYLLSRIEEYPALWRQTHRLYKEKTAQRSAWEEILTSMKDKFDNKLMEHQLHTVPDLMGAFSSLKAGLTQAVKSSRRKTGMAASEVQPITWPYYHECEFLRQVSEPLPTQSSVGSQLFEEPLPTQSSVGSQLFEESPSFGMKWDPASEKKMRAIKSKETREKKLKEAEERRSHTDEAVMSTLSSARDTLESIEKRKKEERRKRKKEDNDEVDQFFAYMATKSRKVIRIFSIIC